MRSERPRQLAPTLGFPVRYAKVSLWDWLQNRHFVRGDRRFLVARDPRSPFFYDVLLHWLAAVMPDVRALFELRVVPCPVRNWSRYALHVPWFQDPVEGNHPWIFRVANRLAAQCDRRGIPVVNRVDRLANAGKASAAKLIASAGLRTARTIRIENLDEFRRSRLGLSLPLFVREDWGHGGAVLRADTDAEMRALPIETLRRPVASEIIDVRTPADGLFRKYRYVVAGEVGVSQTLHVSEKWVTRGTENVYSEAIRDEEIAFTRRPEPHHARFVAATKALGLDFVAFDYGFDRDGEIAVWEANPYPFLHFLSGRRAYRAEPTARVFAAMTKLYLDRAGMDVPFAVDRLLAG